MDHHLAPIILKMWASRQWRTDEIANRLMLPESVVANTIARAQGRTEPAVFASLSNGSIKKESGTQSEVSSSLVAAIPHPRGKSSSIDQAELDEYLT